MLARARCPGQHLERRRVGSGDGVGLENPGEPLDGGPVESDALFECTLEFGRSDRDRLQVPEHVGEPQTDESDIPFFQRTQDEFLLAVHDASVGIGC